MRGTNNEGLGYLNKINLNEKSVIFKSNSWLDLTFSNKNGFSNKPESATLEGKKLKPPKTLFDSVSPDKK